MKKFENLGRKLSKEEQKYFRGGTEEESHCIGLFCEDNGYESCWHSTRTVAILCDEVYPNCQNCSGGSVVCSGCYS